MGKDGGFELSKEGMTSALKDLGIEKQEDEYDLIYTEFFKTE